MVLILYKKQFTMKNQVSTFLKVGGQQKKKQIGLPLEIVCQNKHMG